MGNCLMTPVFGDGFVPSDYIFNNCSGIQVTSIGTDYDGHVSIEGIVVPKSLRERMLNKPNSSTGLYKKIIINPPATIIIWNDGTKTVVKATENDIYDPEKGVALCFLKKYFGSSYRKILKEANDIYEKKLEEDAELNNSEMGARLFKGFTASLTEITNEAIKRILGDEEKTEETNNEVQS